MTDSRFPRFFRVRKCVATKESGVGRFFFWVKELGVGKARRSESGVPWEASLCCILICLLYSRTSLQCRSL